MKSIVLLITYLLFISSAHAEAIKCTQTPYRAFDFWLGTWQVTTTNDTIIRHSKISAINDGCTILEEYSTPSGYTGKSLNIYDNTTKKWHQTWTDNGGLLLQLNGNLVGNSMVMTGLTIDENNKSIVNKITWSPMYKDSLRQFWQTSRDNGKTWQTAFDGLYTRIP